MLDIRWIRDNPDAFDAALKTRGMDPMATSLIDLDAQRRATQTDLQEAQTRRNEASKQIGTAKASGGDAEALIAEVATLKDRMRVLEGQEQECSEQLQTALSTIPNVPKEDVPEGEDEEGADGRLREIAGELESRGRRPYVIPLSPGHRPLGALGYVVAAQEIGAQMEFDSVSFDEIVVPSGSGNTHAGLLFGLRALGCASRVTGVCVRRDATAQRDRIQSCCGEIADLLGIGSPVSDADIRLIDDFLAPGYGLANEATLGAIETAARSEALILDPVYSGKTMAGFIHRAGEAGKGRALLFIHTGGAPAVFAYGTALTESLRR